jgi:hypothetical protein
MAREYGEIYSLKIASGTVVVLSSKAAVREVLEKNSSVVSDRPANYIANEVTGGTSMALARYGIRFFVFSFFIKNNDNFLGNSWRRHRRCAQEVLTVQACRSHLKIQHAEATQLMFDVLTKPAVSLLRSYQCLLKPTLISGFQNFYDAIQRLSGSVMLSLLYGQRIPRLSTPEIVDLLDSISRIIEILEPGSHPPIDLIPVLKMIPERWASWKTEIKSIKLLYNKVYFGLLEKVERRLNQGTSTGCFMEAFIDKAPAIGLDRYDIR